MYYKLIDPIKVPKNLNLAGRENGLVRYRVIRLVPGKKYEIPEDKTLLSELKNATETEKYTEAKEAALIDAGVSYETVMCKSCGGRVKKLKYHIVEVVE